jgi:hypothetical protein
VTPEKPLQTSPSNERKWVLLLCCLAAIHVFVFCAAFPFFNNVDECAHFDLVLKYSHGEIPRHLGAVGKDALGYIAIYDTPEYFWPSNKFYPAEQFRPPWTLSKEEMSAALLTREQRRANTANHEFSQAPLYYVVAGLWFDLTRWTGLELYCVRFLNIVFIVALVWLGHAAARMIFPENHFMRIGVPAMLAFLPQSAFYSINNDVLSPLSFGAAFICLVQLCRADIPGVKLGITTGLTFAATYLTKISNLPLLFVAAAIILIKAWLLIRSGKWHSSSRAFAALALVAGLPIACWLVWCKLIYGDFTGSAAKIHILGWTPKPFADWLHHPIFTPHGLWFFASENLASFWRGELAWHHRRLALPAADTVYVIASVCFPSLAVFAASRLKMATTAQRQALLLGFGCCLAALAFLGFLSIIYDFHNCIYPSREYPYFISGRLMLGALVPFMLLFMFGLDCALKHFSTVAKFIVLAAILLFMLVTEIIADWPVYTSPYNWFHM